MTVKIGTRGSKLALWQAYFIEQKLRSAGLGTEIMIIETKGDKILDRSLSKIGSKGVFTEELEEQLLSGKIDIAVHSAKDLQSDLGENFKILAFTEREKVNDVLVSLISNLKVNTKDKFTVGTSSTRRVAMSTLWTCGATFRRGSKKWKMGSAMLYCWLMPEYTEWSRKALLYTISTKTSLLRLLARVLWRSNLPLILIRKRLKLSGMHAITL